MKKQKFSGWAVAAGCLLYMFMLYGFMGTAGIILPYFSAELNIPVSKLGVLITATTFSGFLLNLAVGKVIGKIGAKATMFIGILCLIAYCIGTYFATTLLQLILIMFLIGGVVAFGCMAPCSIILTEWFIEKRVAVITFIFTGMGFGGSVFIPVAGVLMERYGYRVTHLIMGAVIAAVLIPANLFLIRNSPESCGQKPYGWEKHHADDAAPDAATVREGVDFSDAIRSKSFWLLIVGTILSGFLVTSVRVYAGAYFQHIGMDPITAANYLGLFALFGAVCSVFVGILANRFGGKLYITMTVAAYLAGVLLLLYLVPSAGPVAVIGALLLFGFCYPLSSTTPSITTAEAFGRKSYDRILGFYQACIQMGAGIVPIIFGFALEAGGYTLAYSLIQCCGLAAFVLIFTALSIAPWKKKTEKEKALPAITPERETV